MSWMQQLTEMMMNTSSQSAYMTHENIAVERFQGHLVLTQVSDCTVAPFELKFATNNSLKINDRLSLVKVDNVNEADLILPLEGCELVKGGSNLIFRYASNRPSKPLKKWYQEWQISPKQRQQTLVIQHENRALAVFLTDDVKFSIETDCAQPIAVKLIHA